MAAKSPMTKATSSTGARASAAAPGSNGNTSPDKDKRSQPLQAIPAASKSARASSGKKFEAKLEAVPLGKKKKESSRTDLLQGLDFAQEPEVFAAIKDGETSSLAWSVLNNEVVQELVLLEVPELLSRLSQILGIENWKEDLQTNILLSYHLNNFLFAKDKGFAAIQISTFFSIMKFTLDRITDEGLSMEKTLTYFKRLVLNHSASKTVENQSNLWEVFRHNESQLAIDYAVLTLFQHYSLYRHVFTTEQVKIKIELSVEPEMPKVPPPLEEALSLEEYEFDQRRKEHEAEFEKIALLPIANLLEHPEAIVEQTDFNPLEVLPPALIQEIVQGAVQGLVGKLSNQFHQSVEEHRTRSLAKAAAAEHGVSGKSEGAKAVGKMDEQAAIKAR